MTYVRRAFRANSGAILYEIGATDTCWISSDEFRQDSEDAKQRAQAAGVPMVSNANWRALRSEAEECEIEPDTEGVVAEGPGWVADDIFAHGDGSVYKCREDKREVIAAFDPDDGFGKKRTLRGWRRGFDRIVPDTPLITALLSYGFVAPLLAVAPSNLLNPQLELVGPAESGKTIIAKAVMSIYGGDPGSELGIGRSWDMTPMAFEGMRNLCRDGTLFMDENSIQATNDDLIAHIAFAASSSGSRSRYGEAQRKPAVRFALLSTGNVPLSSRKFKSADVQRAVKTRMISLQFDGPLIANISAEFDNTRAAMEALNAHCDRYYGTAIRAFIQKVADASRDDEAAFRGEVAELMQLFKDKSPAVDHKSSRILDTFSLIYAAGQLARRWNILPEKSSDVMKSVMMLYRRAARALMPVEQADAIKTVKAAIRKGKADIVSVTRSNPRTAKPVQLGTLGTSIKFDDGSKRYYLRPDELHARLGTDSQKHLQALRDAGILLSEVGRLAKKAPRIISDDARVYELRF